MSPSTNSNMPLSREDLIKLKHSIEPNDYQVVAAGNSNLLVIRSPQEYPDIVNDLESLINKFDMRDVDQADQVCIIGDAEVVGVSIEAIKSLMDRRIEDDEQIATDLEEKLSEPYDTLSFHSDDDPFKILRLGIRIPGSLEDFKPQQLRETLFSKIKDLPRESEIVYLIAKDGYLRLSGKEFYKYLGDFLREHSDKNREMKDEFLDIAKGTLANHFVGKGPETEISITGKQEQLNNYLDVPERSIEVENTEDIKKKIEVDGAKEIAALLQLEQETAIQIPEPEPALTSVEPKPISSPEIKLETKLESKLSESGFQIVSGIMLSGVDVVANTQENVDKKLFFSFMPQFDFRKALALEKAIEQHTPGLGIIIGSKDDVDTKLFVIGKNIVLTDIDTILNTDFLNRPEDQQ